METGVSQVQVLTSVETTIWILIGILLSLILPIAVKTLQQAKLESTAPSIGERISEAWKKYGGNKYLTIFLAATLVAVVIVFLLGQKFYTARDAVLAGFAWESFVNKLVRKPEDS